MPCRTDDYPEQPMKSPAETIVRLKDEADKVTRLLCSVLTIMNKHADTDNSEAYEVMSSLQESVFETEGLSEWWTAHKEVDRQRIRNEIALDLNCLSLEQLRAIKATYENN
jgi:hypothetical protein